MVLSKRKFDVKNADLLLHQGEVVMSRSELPFFTEIFKRLSDVKPRAVLEVGFGLGISARLIQKYLRPEFHDIVEIDPVVYEDSRAFARRRSGVRAILGDFGSFVKEREYDFIFYDVFDYSEHDEDPEADEAAWTRRVRFLLKPGGIVCVPSFGPSEPESVRGFRRVLFEKLEVPKYLLEDGSWTTIGVMQCWQRPLASGRARAKAVAPRAKPSRALARGGR
jgi:spermidine synthase